MAALPMIAVGVLTLGAWLTADVRSAGALLEQGKTVEALEDMRKTVEASPADPEVQYQFGEMLRRLGAERAARLQSLAPESGEAHELLGRSLESAGKLDTALKEYRTALQKNPAAPGFHFLAGNVLWKQRDFQAARPELEAELQLNPNHALANLRLGEVLLSLDDPTAAQFLQKAVAADSSSVEAHQALGKAYRLISDHSAALKEFQIVASRRPFDEAVHAQLAGEYRALGQADRANEEWAKHRRLLAEKAAAARPKQPAAGR